MSRKHLVRVLTVLVLAALVLPLALVGVRAAGEPAGRGVSLLPVPQETPTSPDLPGEVPEQSVPTYPNLEYHLDQLASQVERGEVSPRQAALETPLHEGEAVLVTFWLSGNADGVAEFLEGNGADVRNMGEDYIEAYVPVALLGPASEQPGVLRVSEIVPPQPEFGPTISQGVPAHGVENWHGSGFTGETVKVGIIDIGFEEFQELMGTELPDSVEVRCYPTAGMPSDVLADCDRTSLHGTGVAEALLDVAPDISLYISDPFTRADVRDAAEWMVSEGVSVINQSVSSLFDGPGDGTSPFSDSPLKTVDEVVEQGGVWVNSAGNRARQTWFRERPDTNTRRLVLFDGADFANRFSLGPGQGVTIQLRWQDSWSGANRDYDLFLWDRLAREYVARSENQQSGAAGHIPYEYLRYESEEGSYYDIVVAHNRGSRPSWMQLMAFSVELEHHTKLGSVTSPSESANPGLISVGATPWYYPHTIEFYSSRGPTPDGRDKPDITGADCGATVTYAELVESRPGCWFPGTSQAAPHVAGLAALVRQRFPDYTPEETAKYLMDHASPRGDVPNSTWGHGFAQLPPIVTAPVPGPGPTPTDPCGVAVTGDGTLSGEWAEGCQSEVSGRGYARYFSFTLAEASEVTITLESETDTFLYLREGSDRSGAALHDNDDLESGNTNSRIQESLTAGPYTVEATTYDEAQEDSFTLTFDGLGAAAASPGPPAVSACVVNLGPLTGEVRQSGQWTGDCDSTNREGRHARFYTFSLSQQREVQIDLTSENDTFLYLLEGAGMEGAIEAENDDVESGNTNSRIEETLAAGAYTIEATTYNADETGSFTLVLAPR